MISQASHFTRIKHRDLFYSQNNCEWQEREGIGHITSIVRTQRVGRKCSVNINPPFLLPSNLFSPERFPPHKDPMIFKSISKMWKLNIQSCKFSGDVSLSNYSRSHGKSQNLRSWCKGIAILRPTWATQWRWSLLTVKEFHLLSTVFGHSPPPTVCRHFTLGFYQWPQHSRLK